MRNRYEDQNNKVCEYNYNLPITISDKNDQSNVCKWNNIAKEK